MHIETALREPKGICSAGCQGKIKGACYDMPGGITGEMMKWLYKKIILAVIYPLFEMNIKTLLPFEQYVFVTKLSIPEISKRITDRIDLDTRSFPFLKSPGDGKLFTGYVLGDQFELVGIIQYRSSFLPVITGEMNNCQGTTAISVRHAPVQSVLIAFICWMGMGGLMCLGMLLYGITHLHLLKIGVEMVPSLIPFAVFIIGASMMIIAFKTEYKRVRKALLELLEGKMQSRMHQPISTH